VVFWIGWGLLLTAVVRDAWTIYRDKRRMHRAINEAIASSSPKPRSLEN
jgi:hypothetical protein